MRLEERMFELALPSDMFCNYESSKFIFLRDLAERSLRKLTLPHYITHFDEFAVRRGFDLDPLSGEVDDGNLFGKLYGGFVLGKRSGGRRTT